MKPPRSSLLVAALTLCNASARAQDELLSGFSRTGGFGWSVDVDGGTALVGAWGHDGTTCADEGRAATYVWNGSTWIQDVVLDQGPPECDAAFGESVAIDGDTIVVGADFANGGTGGAYVFERAGVFPSIPTQDLVPANLVPFDDYGNVVVIDGDTIAVSAPESTRHGFSRAGSVYVWTRSGTTWAQQAEILPPTVFAGSPTGLGDDATFGYSGLALDGDQLIVGMPYRYDASRSGEAWVFARTGTTWSATARLLPSTSSAANWFGWRVGIEGDTAVASAPREDTGAVGDQGLVTVFARVGTTWTESTTLQGLDTGPGDLLGSGLDLAGDRLAVGSSGDEAGRGSVFVFERLLGVWSAGCKLHNSEVSPLDRLGISVASFGDLVLAGSDLHDHTGTGSAGVGAAFLYDLATINWAPFEPYCTAGTTTNGCSASVSGAGVPSASAASAFQITIDGVEGQKLGIVFYGITGKTSSTWGAGTSFLCVKAPTQRTPVQGSGGAAGQCDGTMTLDWNAYLAANPSALGSPLSAGTTVFAQGWFRDPPSPKTTSLSDALEFCIQP